MAETETNANLGGAAKTLTDFSGGTVPNAADTIEKAMSRAFSSVEKTIAKTAASGKLSMKDMVDAIVADCERIAAQELIVKPMESLLSSVIGAVMPVAGARASGGPVAGGSAYLVGEQGPEVFVPASSGTVATGMGQSRASVVLNVKTADAKSFLQSESQIAAMMLRGLARGKRNL